MTEHVTITGEKVAVMLLLRVKLTDVGLTDAIIELVPTLPTPK